MYYKCKLQVVSSYACFQMLLNELPKKEKESYICFNNVPRYIQ